MVTDHIMAPHVLPLFRQDRARTTRKMMEKDRLDPVKSRRPDLPIKSGNNEIKIADGNFRGSAQFFQQ